MKITFISDSLSSVFEKLGRIIARCPIHIIIASVLLSVLLSLGLLKLKTSEHVDYLVKSDRGKIFRNKQFIEKTFPINTSEFYDFTRITDRPQAAMVYIKNKYGNNLIQKDNLLEIQHLDEIIKNITIVVNEKVINYSVICGIVNKKCMENPIINIMSEMDYLLSGRKKLKFPIQIDPFTYKYNIWLFNFGGVKYDEEGYVKEVECMRLVYPVDESDFNKTHWIREWRKAFLSNVNKLNFHSIEVYPCPILATELDVEVLAKQITPLISVAFIVATFFCVMTYMTNSWVRSKPWMGIAAVVSAGLAVVSSFGLMGACGVENIKYNIILPFLIFATEIDDAFVIVANWRITDVEDSVEARMGKTYSKSAVSITITTLTNILSFCIAMTAEFPGVRAFSYYATTCVCFTYLYQILFFGSCLALSGYREVKSLNAFTFKVAKERSNENQSSEKNELAFMNFFREYFAEFLSYSFTKVMIIILYIVNLTIGIWGVTFLHEGLNTFKFYSNDSKITEGYRIFYGDFTEFAFPVQIVINKTLDYSQEDVQKSIENIMLKFKSHPNVAGSEFEFSWLKYYKEFQNHPVSKFALRGYDMTQKQDFIDGLRNVFLRIKAAKQFSNDIVFNNNYTDITCSRFFLVTKNITHGQTERTVIIDMMQLAEQSDLPIIIHSYFSSSIEQSIITKQITLQLFWLTAVVLFVVFLSFVPNIVCGIIVAIAVVSIIVETVGYMSLWAVNLDVFSMMAIILCNGFCVNYPTHISYAFLTSSHSNSKEKLKESLFHVGFPILQGSISTIIVLLIFLYSSMYAYTTFVKIVVLISLQTFFHAVAVIPVFLSLLYQLFAKKNDNNRFNSFEMEYNSIRDAKNSNQASEVVVL
ncbi:patched domain-containing protein 3-like [Centruroides sculpturatus]|uniref:patched domain-containing protein 3-like n=1 Tax=Centruroides sculpturatus TaxID=218467 RepID=UPI000C6E3C32|nr:patched domain-containing protein 3-like [Centruroides sculpturatus]